MKPLIGLTAALLLVAVAAFGTEMQDTDGDGVYSLEEMQRVYPDLDETAFAALDLDGDGALSPDEVAVARDTGMLGA